MLFLIAIPLLLAVVLITIYNGLVGKRQNCNQGWADIDAQLKQRHDLIPNLVETVKGYATHEKATLEAVIVARGKAMGATTPADAAAAEGQLSGALKSLFALGEAYPDLKANTNFQTLQHELSDVEDKLAASRRAYNAAAADYNGAREGFPAIMFASAMGFSARPFWELDDGDRALASAAPEVKF
jgi:LemA protein